MFISTYQYLIDSFETYAASALVGATFMRYIAAGVMVPVSYLMYEKLGCSLHINDFGMCFLSYDADTVCILQVCAAHSDSGHSVYSGRLAMTIGGCYAVSIGYQNHEVARTCLTHFS